MEKNRKISAKLKLLCFSILLIGSYFTSNSHAHAQELLMAPPCTTTTCITGEMIGVAKHALVARDNMVFNVPFLRPRPCVPSRPTGVTVYRQVPRRIIRFPDSFCTNQGCTPPAATGNAAPPAGVCTVR